MGSKHVHLFSGFIIAFWFSTLPYVQPQCNAIIDSFATTANTQMLTAGRQDYYVSLNDQTFAPTTVPVVIQGTSQVVAITRTILQPQGGAGVSTTSLIPLTTTTVSVVSSSASDTGAGTGCRTLRVDGLNSAGNTASETITLAGTTPVLTTATFSWVQKITCITVGTGLTNAGTITATAGGLAQSVIEIGLTPSLINPGMSRQARYRVPTAQRATLKNIYVAVGREAGAANLLGIYFYLRSQATATSPVLTHNIFILDYDSTVMAQYTPLMNQYFEAGTVVWLEVISNAAVTTNTAFAEMNFLLTV